MSDTPKIQVLGSLKGERGKSAYDLALELGFEGTLEDWLNSLVGADGKNGTDGTNGTNGKDGNTPYIQDGYWYINGVNTNVKAVGVDGTNGKDGVDGKDYVLTDTDKEEIAGMVDVSGGLTTEQQALLTKLDEWYEKEHYVAMTGTFSMSPNTTYYEIGASQSVKFSWSFSKLPAEVKFNGTVQTVAQSGSSTVTVTSQSHKTLTYSLYGKYKEGETVSKSLSINFRNKYYYGYKAIPTTIDSDFIKSLDKNGWANAKTISFTPNCVSGTYVWYAYPKRLGASTMWMGGFQGGFEEPLTVSVTNSSGYTEDYYVYRSTNSGIGDLSIQAK